jgi:hypothetical protein
MTLLTVENSGSEVPSSYPDASHLAKKRHQLQMIFDALDYGKDGVISAQDLVQFQKTVSKGAKGLSEVSILSQQTIEDMIQRADAYANYPLDFEAFEQLVQKMDVINDVSRAEKVLESWIQPNSTIESTPITTTTTTIDTPMKTTEAIVLGGGSSRLAHGLEEYVKSVKHFLAGGIAGAISRTAVSPLERMKILFQLQGLGAVDRYRGIIATLGKILREEGIRGYFKGNGTNVIRIVPYSAIQFASYERYKKVKTRVCCYSNTIRKKKGGGFSMIVYLFIYVFFLY